MPLGSMDSVGRGRPLVAFAGGLFTCVFLSKTHGPHLRHIRAGRLFLRILSGPGMTTPTPIVTPAIQDVVRAGRFRDGLRLLEQRYDTSLLLRGRIEVPLLKAELLEHLGRTPEAIHLLGRIRASGALDSLHAARAFLLQGSIAKRRGHLSEATGAFELAARAALEAGDARLHWWARLRLLSGCEEGASGEELGERYAVLGTSVIRLGDPEIAVAYHVFRGEQDAKRGHLEDSEDHTAAAESLLSGFPSLWLQGLLHLQRSCLAYLNGNFRSAHAHASSAFSIATESGHHHTECSALVNLGSAYLALGQPLRAVKSLQRAQEIAGPSTTVRAMALETLAEAWLATRCLTECSQLLDSVSEELQSHSQVLSAWHAGWSLSTRIRLRQVLAAQRGPAKQTDVPEPPTSVWNCSSVGQRLCLLNAANRLQVGDLEGAERSLAELERAGELTSATIRGQMSALTACLFQHRRATDRADALYRTALIVLAAAGDIADMVDCVQSYARHLSEADRRFGNPDGSAEWVCTALRRPVTVTSAVDKSTRLDHPGACTPSMDLGELVRIARHHVQHPAVVGELALRFLAEQGLLLSGILIQSSEGGTRRVLVSYGTAVLTDEAAHTLARHHLDVLVGSRDGLDYSIYAELSESLAAAQMGRAVAQLLATAPRRTQTPAGGRGRSSGPITVLPGRKEVIASPVMHMLLSSARRAAATDGTVLVTGESGTGKEVLARFVHDSSPRSARPFVPFNCSTVPKDMIDSQLFGHRRGAFTGASEGFEGMLLGAAGGTIFLDEIAELPLDVQPKLLRFLDAGEIHPLGESRPVVADVRVIAATNVDPEVLVSTGRFRQDLYYRLNVFRLRIPPLRERPEDVEVMVDFFLAEHQRRLNRINTSLSQAARTRLLLFPWPGNVRQLSSELFRAIANSDDGDTIGPEVLSREIREYCPHSRGDRPQDAAWWSHLDVDRPLQEFLAQAERAAVEHALTTAGSLTGAASKLGLSRKGLYLKRQRLGL
jgi:DNA-binding NtrC family response regulator/tetratricopeptide (TPR) repeat protein